MPPRSRGRRKLRFSHPGERNNTHTAEEVEQNNDFEHSSALAAILVLIRTRSEMPRSVVEIEIPLPI